MRVKDVYRRRMLPFLMCCSPLMFYQITCRVTCDKMAEGKSQAELCTAVSGQRQYGPERRDYSLSSSLN